MGASLALPALTFARAAGGSGSNAAIELQLAALEHKHGGRLGVTVLNLSTGATAWHRADERFLLCSTFKTLLAAYILLRVEKEQETLERVIRFSRADLVEWSPVTETRTGKPGMTIAELCRATVTTSDNTAANLLLDACGGPDKVTAFLRSLGDPTTRLDRFEPALNEHSGADDLRDTTTPGAIVATLRTLFFTETLSQRSRSELAAWHVANRTGDARLRAGLPKDWLVGDKTGTNRTGMANDIAVAWPVDRGPVIVAAYCDMPEASAADRDGVMAEVGRLAAGV
jgi:beta-lactamase class A